MTQTTPDSPVPSRFQPLEVVGAGGTAEISRTLDRHLRRLVALKLLRPDAVLLGDSVWRGLAREMLFSAYLDHPGIVPIYDKVQQGQAIVGYTMKLIGGETLGRRIGFHEPEELQFVADRPLAVADSVLTMRRIAETLAYAHDRGVLHLDIKPANVMIGSYGEVYVVDWGNGRLFDPVAYRSYLGEHLRQQDLDNLCVEPEQLVIGTIGFLSPEQMEGDRSTLRPASDVFSAGVLFYLLLTGRMPFVDERGRAARILFQVEAPEVDALRASVPRRLAQIVARMIALDPAERYADFHELIADLDAYQAAGQGFDRREFAAGDVIFDEAEAGDCSYSILSGRVAVDRSAEGETQRIAELGPGEVLGEIAILTDQPRTARATAIEPTVLRVMPRAEVREELEKLAPWVGSMVKALGDRFVGLTEEVGRLRAAKGPNSSE